MVEANGIYKCNICGNIVSVLEAKDPSISCCGQEMELLKEKTGDEEGAETGVSETQVVKEKHVPVIEKSDTGVIVKVGSIPHPMEDDHYIELIQLIKDGTVVIGKRLKPGDKPEVEFCCIADDGDYKARILCNLHGVWVN